MFTVYLNHTFKYLPESFNTLEEALEAGKKTGQHFRVKENDRIIGFYNNCGWNDVCTNLNAMCPNEGFCHNCPEVVDRLGLLQAQKALHYLDVE